MLKTEHQYGRPASSQKRIVMDLRCRIINGELSPGSQFPTRAEIEQQYGAGPVTVQRALEELRREGFVRVQGRRGTFVADNPPHLSRYAVVFMETPNGANYGLRFLTALRGEVERAHRTKRWNLPQYYGLDGHQDSEDYQRLVSEVRTHRVAGLIFMGNPFGLLNTPILDEPGIPRVAIMDRSPKFTGPILHTNTDEFFAKAFAYLQNRGRRKVAFVDPLVTRCMNPKVVAAHKACGLETRKYWYQYVSVDCPEAAENCVHLLMHPGQTERPDALIIGDDNLLEYATAGLIAAGVRVPEDVDVVAHCNFPYPTPAVVPVKRLGYDARQIVATCIQSIDRQRAGEEVPLVTEIGAIFEEEFQANLDQELYF